MTHFCPPTRTGPFARGSFYSSSGLILAAALLLVAALPTASALLPVGRPSPVTSASDDFLFHVGPGASGGPVQEGALVCVAVGGTNGAPSAHALRLSPRGSEWAGTPKPIAPPGTALANHAILPSPLGRPQSTNFSSVSVDVGTWPYDSAYDGGNGWEYVANSGSNNVSVLNGTKLIGTVAVGSAPEPVVYDPEDNYVYVVNLVSNNVTVLQNLTVIGSVNVGTMPQFAALDTYNGDLYVSNFQSNNVSVINGTTLVGAVTVDPGPGQLAYDSASGNVYVPSLNGRNLSILNGTALRSTVDLNLSSISATYDADDREVYIITGGTGGVIVFNGTTRIGTVRDGTTPEFATYDNTNGDLYLSNPSNVSVIHNLTVLGSVPSGPTPESGTVDVQSGEVYIPNVDSTTVTVINGTTQVGTAQVGLGPVGLSFDSRNGFVYVPNVNSNNVTILGAVAPRAYNVTFAPSGLSASQHWGVTLNGTTELAAGTSSISFSEVNGTYAFAVVLVSGWVASPTSGVVVVNGAASDLNVSFGQTAPTTFYLVSLKEAGLPSGTFWSAEVNGSVSRSNTSANEFAEPNGTYTVRVFPVPNYSVNYSTSVVVEGAPATVEVSYSVSTYAVVIVESGLPSGGLWSATATNSGGTSTAGQSTGTALTLQLPNGSYTLTASGPPEYTGTFSAPALTIDGSSPASISVSFAGPTSLQAGLFAFPWLLLVSVVIIGLVAAVGAVGFQRSRYVRWRSEGQRWLTEYTRDEAELEHLPPRQGSR
jgi:YVTN family beta-propeller protein